MTDVKKKIESLRAKKTGAPRPIAERMAALTESGTHASVFVNMAQQAVKNANSKLELELQRIDRMKERPSEDWTEEEQALWESTTDVMQTLLQALNEADNALEKLSEMDI